jgi:hypothetical protein
MPQDPSLAGDDFPRPKDGVDGPAVPEPLAQIYCIGAAS